MFTKFISLFVLVVPLVSALTVNIPNPVTNGGSITVTWTSAAGDPSLFSLELVNLNLNFPEIAIATTVDATLGTLTTQLPVTATPGDGYTVVAVNISDINKVFATSAPFPIGATVSGSITTTPTASVTGTNTNTLSSSANSLASVSSASGISSTGTSTGTGTVTGTGSTGTGTGTSTSTGTDTGTGTGTSTGASTTASSAAASSRLALTNFGGYAALLLSAIAGAAAIAL